MQRYLLFSSGVFSGEPADTAPRSEPRPNRPDFSAALKGKRVVIVEDEGLTQMQLRRMLKSAGLTVLASAGSGEEGVKAVLDQRPDLVLMDIRMPGPIDGLEAAQRILSEYHVCVVILTAFSDDDYRKRAQDLNACGYLVKPVTSETLLPQLEAALQRFALH